VKVPSIRVDSHLNTYSSECIMDQMGIRTLSPDEIPEKHNWNNQETWDME